MASLPASLWTSHVPVPAPRLLCPCAARRWRGGTTCRATESCCHRRAAAPCRSPASRSACNSVQFLPSQQCLPARLPPWLLPAACNPAGHIYAHPSRLPSFPCPLPPAPCPLPCAAQHQRARLLPRLRLPPVGPGPLLACLVLPLCVSHRQQAACAAQDSAHDAGQPRALGHPAGGWVGGGGWQWPAGQGGRLAVQRQWPRLTAVAG